MNLKRYNSHKTRSLEVTPTAPGQNEWVKRVKTNGQARWKIMGYIFLVLRNYKKRKDQNYD